MFVITLLLTSILAAGPESFHKLSWNKAIGNVSRFISNAYFDRYLPECIVHNESDHPNKKCFSHFDKSFKSVSYPFNSGNFGDNFDESSVNEFVNRVTNEQGKSDLYGMKLFNAVLISMTAELKNNKNPLQIKCNSRLFLEIISSFSLEEVWNGSDGASNIEDTPSLLIKSGVLQCSLNVYYQPHLFLNKVYNDMKPEMIPGSRENGDFNSNVELDLLYFINLRFLILFREYYDALVQYYQEQRFAKLKNFIGISKNPYVGAPLFNDLDLIQNTFLETYQKHRGGYYLHDLTGFIHSGFNRYLFSKGEIIFEHPNKFFAYILSAFWYQIDIDTKWDSETSHTSLVDVSDVDGI